MKRNYTNLNIESSNDIESPTDKKFLRMNLEDDIGTECASELGNTAKNTPSSNWYLSQNQNNNSTMINDLFSKRGTPNKLEQISQHLLEKSTKKLESNQTDCQKRYNYEQQLVNTGLGHVNDKTPVIFEDDSCDENTEQGIDVHETNNSITGNFAKLSNKTMTLIEKIENDKGKIDSNFFGKNFKADKNFAMGPQKPDYSYIYKSDDVINCDIEADQNSSKNLIYNTYSHTNFDFTKTFNNYIKRGGLHGKKTIFECEQKEILERKKHTQLLKELDTKKLSLSSHTANLIAQVKIRYEEKKSVTPNQPSISPNQSQKTPDDNQSIETTSNFFTDNNSLSKAKRLLQHTKNFIIPSCYDLLLKKFERLDFQVNFFTSKSKPTFFSTLQNSMRSSHNAIDLPELQNILAISSGCYQIEWEKNESTNRWDLYISFPQDENNGKSYSQFLSKTELDNRKKQFRDHIINLIQNRHEVFLKNQAPPITNYNYKKEGVWHHQFNVEDIKEVNESRDLPIKPKNGENSYLTMREFQNHGSEKNNFDEASTRLSSSMFCGEEDGQRSEAFTSCSTNLGVKLIEIVKEKERVLKKANSEVKDPSKSKGELVCDKSAVRNIVDNVRMYYACRKVSNMFLVNVVGYLQKNNSFRIYYQDEIYEMLLEVVRQFPEWLKIVKHCDGDILRVDKGFDFSKVGKNLL